MVNLILVTRPHGKPEDAVYTVTLILINQKFENPISKCSVAHDKYEHQFPCRGRAELGTGKESDGSGNAEAQSKTSAAKCIY